MLPMHDIDIIAHRGASGVVNEANSPLAFERAISLACDFIETDLRLCGKDTIVCFHDNHIDGELLINMSLDELRERSPVAVPTLNEWLDQCAGKIKFDVEVKETGFEGPLLEILGSYNIDDDVIIKSFSLEVLERLRDLNCSYPLGLLIGGCPKDQDVETHLAAASANLNRLNLDFISPAANLIDDTFFSDDYFANTVCLVWTVNDPVRMHELLNFPIHGIITDRPDLAQCVCQKSAPQLQREDVITAINTLTDEELIAYLSHGVLSGTARIDTLAISTHDDLKANLNDWIHAAWGPQAQACLVFDEDCHLPICDELLALDNITTSYILKKRAPFDHLTPHVDYCQQVQSAAKNCDGIIAFGGGTVNDICKYAAYKNEQQYISCATAASMNGYTSGIAALLVDDLKSTLPCPPPIAVLNTPSLIQGAPLRLSQSGYADLLSKYVSVGDWKLASLIRGEDFDDLPGDIAGSAIQRCMESATGIGNQDADSIQVLMRAIILSGFSMALAGSSAPASGGEHLISHYLDMTAYSEQRCPELHGLQVALGTLLSSRLYETLRALDPQTFTPQIYSEASLQAAHGALWPIVGKTASAQIPSQRAAEERLSFIKEHWSHIWQELDPYLKTYAEITQALQDAGVACHPQAYGIDSKLIRTAFIYAADIRDRYTVLHFARDCGVLEQIADEVLNTAFSQ